MAKTPRRKMACEAVIFDAERRVLLVRQGNDRGDWELPGGKVKKRESLRDAIIREVNEETGVDVLPVRTIGVFYIAEENYFDWVIECQLTGTNTKPRANPPEIVEVGFFATGDLPKPIRAFTADRITDARLGFIHPLPVEINSKKWLGQP